MATFVFPIDLVARPGCRVAAFVFPIDLVARPGCGVAAYVFLIDHFPIDHLLMPARLFSAAAVCFLA